VQDTLRHGAASVFKQLAGAIRANVAVPGTAKTVYRAGNTTGSERRRSENSAVRLATSADSGIGPRSIAKADFEKAGVKIVDPFVIT
jgi:hypothetical protein